MNDDKTFYGTILAIFALLFGHPGWAFLIFLLAIM
jgi:hypothetical protein